LKKLLLHGPDFNPISHAGTFFSNGFNSNDILAEGSHQYQPLICSIVFSNKDFCLTVVEPMANAIASVADVMVMETPALFSVRPIFSGVGNLFSSAVRELRA
jgi:hypothetical protein